MIVFSIVLTLFFTYLTLVYKTYSSITEPILTALLQTAKHFSIRTEGYSKSLS